MCLCSRNRFVFTAPKRTGTRIRKGDRLLVDGDAKPVKGCYVVTGAGRLERWRGQPVIYGVCVRVERPL
jgi:hypothetical protein